MATKAERGVVKLFDALRASMTAKRRKANKRAALRIMVELDAEQAAQVKANLEKKRSKRR